MIKTLCMIISCTILVNSAPDGYVKGGVSTVGEIPSLFVFENGKVGVNFLGFKASAGLGGLLTGKSGIGGLHAEAETPFGQAARAGIGGNLNGEGKAVGGLFADATAGGDVAAGAGLAGTTGNEESHGVSYASASADGVYKEKTIQKFIVPVKQEVGPVKVVEKHVEVNPQKTYVKETVIPTYEEKTIYVPSYIEKTIRIPTVVEKRVKVPATPIIVEKPVHVASDVNLETSIKHEIPHISTYKHRIHSRPFFKKHFVLGSRYGAGYTGEDSGANYDVEDISGTKSFAIQKTTNAHLDGNVPFTTLGAIKKFVGSFAFDTSGSISA